MLSRRSVFLCGSFPVELTPHFAFLAFKNPTNNKNKTQVAVKTKVILCLSLQIYTISVPPSVLATSNFSIRPESGSSSTRM